MSPLEAVPMWTVYNAFSYLEGVINSGHDICIFIFWGPKLASLKHADPKKNIKIHLSCS
jgi:hypothetical protein